jgi:hypothetical protein
VETQVFEELISLPVVTILAGQIVVLLTVQLGFSVTLLTLLYGTLLEQED